MCTGDGDVIRARCRIWSYGSGAFFVAIVVSGTRPRIQEFSGVSLSCSESVLEIEL